MGKATEVFAYFGAVLLGEGWVVDHPPILIGTSFVGL